jgi:hypothetical protein
MRKEANIRKMTDFIFWNLSSMRCGVFPNQHGVVAFMVYGAGYSEDEPDLKDEMRAFRQWLKEYGHAKKKSHVPSAPQMWVMLVTPRDGMSVTAAAEEVERLLWYTRQEYHGTNYWSDSFVEAQRKRAHDILKEYELEYREDVADDEGQWVTEGGFDDLTPPGFRPSLN